MLKQKLVDITPGSVADYLIRLAVLVLLHIWLQNASDTITEAETVLLSMGEQRHSWCQAREQEDMSQSILIETVRVVRDFLNVELSKYDAWDNVNEIIKVLFDSTRQFQQCKESGVGQTTILKFLGGGWKQWKIQSALDTLNAEDMSMNAII